MHIRRALAGYGWPRLAFIGFCAGVAGGTTLVLAVLGVDDSYCLVAGYAAGVLAFAIPAVLLEWFWWMGPARSVRLWRRSVLSK